MERKRGISDRPLGAVEEVLNTTEDHKVTENEPSKEERLMLRHLIAVKGMRLEQYLSQADQPTFEEFAEQQDLSQLSEKVQDRFREIVREYADRLKKTQQIYVAFLLELFPYLNNRRYSSRRNQREISPVEFGQRFFQAYVGDLPQSSVVLSVDEGKFVMHMGEEDMVHFLRVRGERLHRPQQIPWAPHGVSLNLFKEQFPRRFHRMIGNSSIPVNIVLTERLGEKDPAKVEKDIRRTVVHERQHYINNAILRRFRKTEFQSGDNYNYHGPEGLRGVKDELLARVRDGSEWIETDRILTFGYEEIYPNAAARKKGRELARRFCKIMREASLFEGEEARSVLTNQLLDTPMSRFPERAQELVEYYARRFQQIDRETRQYVVPRGVLGEWLDRRYAPRHAEQLDALKEAYRAYQSAFADIYQGSLWMLESADEKEATTTLRESYRQLMEQVEGLQQELKGVPSVTALLMEKKSYLTEEAAGRIEGPLLEAVESLPQAILQEVFEDALEGNVGSEVVVDSFREAIVEASGSLNPVRHIRVSRVNETSQSMEIRVSVALQMDGLVTFSLRIPLTKPTPAT